MFNQHPLLQPRMRSVLLDWLIEVCEVYRLHRETYYLAMDFLDRYLALTENLPKTQLQLIGKFLHSLYAYYEVPNTLRCGFE